jgi:hypothetical protein
VNGPEDPPSRSDAQGIANMRRFFERRRSDRRAAGDPADTQAPRVERRGDARRHDDWAVTEWSDTTSDLPP